MAADLSREGEPPTPEREPTQKVDQIAELMRIVREREIEPPPRRPEVPTFPRRRSRWGLLSRLQSNETLIWRDGTPIKASPMTGIRPRI